MAIPEKDWYTQQEIADMLHVSIRQVYNVVAVARRLKQIITTVDPNDERVTLVHRDSLPTLRIALHKNDVGDATA